MKGSLLLAINVLALTMIGACSSRPVDEDRRAGPANVLAPDTPRTTPTYGIYFPETYVAQRTPVLFVHGIHGSPRDFRFLIASLDRSRFQPCVFFYASGPSLSEVAGELSEAIAELQQRYDIHELNIVAHSMGGLIARDALLNRPVPAAVEIPVLVTLSSPWGGVASAAFGTRWSPVVVQSWRDVATGSSYLNSLFADEHGVSKRLPTGTHHYLLFSYRRSWSSFGASSDEIISVASQLAPTAQAQATSVYGFDATHSGVLQDGAVAALLAELLEERAGDNRMIRVSPN